MIKNFSAPWELTLGPHPTKRAFVTQPDGTVKLSRWTGKSKRNSQQCNARVAASLMNQATRQYLVFPFAPNAADRHATEMNSCVVPVSPGQGYCSLRLTGNCCGKSESRDESTEP